MVFRLSRYKWYREWKGGLWWRIIDSTSDLVWVNQLSDLPILDSEDYTRKHYKSLPEVEFYRAVANISRNGQWKDDLNLSKYLKAARILRQRGIEDSSIIDILDNCYRSASQEQTTSLPPKEYDWNQLQEILLSSQDLGKR